MISSLKQKNKIYSVITVTGVTKLTNHEAERPMKCFDLDILLAEEKC